ncbi:MAG: hypothetical protein JWO82_999 [Akkermansiaceae bacterium]|nr:hypothetical protein [Akkermansiaceae bacterium]
MAGFAPISSDYPLTINAVNYVLIFLHYVKTSAFSSFHGHCGDFRD